MLNFLYAIGIILGIICLIIKLLDVTDIPHIKHLPEIPGVPIFGNRVQLGNDHARVAQRWAQRYGPVFQTRLGNRVRLSLCFCFWFWY